MRFKLDENLPVETADVLRGCGHDALQARDQGLAGANDERLLQRCRQEARTLVTLDLDFANIRRYPPAESPGLVVLRLRSQSKPSVLAALGRLVEDLRPDLLPRRLCVVDDKTIRNPRLNQQEVQRSAGSTRGRMNSPT
jgi:predicted nuclease of predicted toxin-antitoxin system